ncbi:hypothetical protein LTR85_011202 [Meristemomyces frigidus]|nr:hypothetical protein LTR85_011202 [Meristemomyces frigidus]
MNGFGGFGGMPGGMPGGIPGMDDQSGGFGGMPGEPGRGMGGGGLGGMPAGMPGMNMGGGGFRGMPGGMPGDMNMGGGFGGWGGPKPNMRNMNMGGAGFGIPGMPGTMPPMPITSNQWKETLLQGSLLQGGGWGTDAVDPVLQAVMQAYAGQGTRRPKRRGPGPATYDQSPPWVNPSPQQLIQTPNQFASGFLGGQQGPGGSDNFPAGPFGKPTKSSQRRGAWVRKRKR